MNETALQKESSLRNHKEHVPSCCKERTVCAWLEITQSSNTNAGSEKYISPKAPPDTAPGTPFTATAATPTTTYDPIHTCSSNSIHELVRKRAELVILYLGMNMRFFLLGRNNPTTDSWLSFCGRKDE